MRTYFAQADLLAPRPVAFQQQTLVRFQDVDAAGVVFFPTLLAYMHDAYVAFLKAYGCDLPRVLAQKEWAAPLKHAQADFLSPLRFGDAVDVALVLGVCGQTSIQLGFRLAVAGEAAAVGQTVHVFVDPHGFRPIPVPAAIARAVQTLGAP